MSEMQIQAIKDDVIKMVPKLDIDCLISIKILMEKAIDSALLTLEPTVILENMDITEKVAYLDSISFEELLKREGLTIGDLQDID